MAKFKWLPSLRSAATTHHLPFDFAIEHAFMRSRGLGVSARKAQGQAIKPEINDRGRVERQQLAQEEPADHGDPQGPAQFRTHAGAQRQGHAAQQRRHGGHHDGPEAQQAGLIDGVHRRHTFLALRLQGKIDHHDAVLLHNADEQDQANQRNHAEINPADHERQQGAHTRRRQRGQDGDGMNVAFIQDAQNDVDRDRAPPGSARARWRARPGRTPPFPESPPE